MIRVAVFSLLLCACVKALEEDLKQLKPEETQRNIHDIIQSHEGYNFGGIRYPENDHSVQSTGQKGYNGAYYGKDERDNAYYGKDEGGHGHGYYGKDERDHGHAYYAKDERDHGNGYYGKDERDHGHAYHGKHEMDHDHGQRYHGHYDVAEGLSKDKKQEHQNHHGKYYERKSYERDRGYHYEKAYAYDKIKIHQEKSNYQQSHGAYQDNHSHHRLHDKGHHGGQSYMYFRKSGRNGYGKYGKSFHQDGHQNGLYDNGVHGYGVLIKHTKGGQYKGYY